MATNGSFIQYKVCSYKSKSDDSGSHSYIKVTNDDNHKNFVIESSITQNTGDTAVLYHSFGSLLFSSINISDSKLEWNAAFASSEPFSLSTTNFSNFDNISSDYQSCFYHKSNDQNFYFCNFIDNIVSQNRYGIFYVFLAKLSINRCFFKGNKASKLFFINLGSATANECHFESDNTFERNGNIVMGKSRKTMKFKENLTPKIFSFRSLFSYFSRSVI